MSSPGQSAYFPPGMELIQAGLCPLGLVHPMACWTCRYGHATECHHPLDCEEAQCSHYVRGMDEEDEEVRDELTDRGIYDPETEEDFEELAFEAEAKLQTINRMTAEQVRVEYARQVRIDRGEEHACAGCGCSDSRPCAGGCVWATATLCSRCV